MKPINLLYLLLFLFLFSCKDSGNKKKTAPSIQLTKEYLQKGEQLYRSKCMNCHLQNGKGISNLYPPLANSDYLKEKREESLHMVKFGGSKPIKVNGKNYKGIMPAANLSDQDITILFNYILNAWGNDYGTLSIEEVKAVKQ
jgi:nitrite reductase (NO-forming)